MNNDKNDILLRVENLSQHFNMGRGFNKAVDEISFEIRKGEVFSLVGESGCGKTTMGRTIIRLYQATSGNVWLKNQRICAGIASYKSNIANAKKEFTEKKKQFNAEPEKLAKLKQECDLIISQNNQEIKDALLAQKLTNKQYAQFHVDAVKASYLPRIEKIKTVLASNPKDLKVKQEFDEVNSEFKEKLRIAKRETLTSQIQMIFQDPISSLNPRMTVGEIIAEGLIIKGFRNKKVIRERVYEMLNLVGLVPEHASRYPHEFSGGQRQRIGIARAIILEPQLLIADEPISALDVSIQAQVITLLKELQDKIGLTILFIAHDISVVKYFSDRIAVMYYGKIMEMATTAELFARPMHPYTRALLSAVPYPDPHYEKSRKRIIYNPLSSHDYSLNKPEMREITNGHFIFCNDEEFEKYKTEFNL